MEAVGSASKHGRLVAHPLLGLRVAGWRAWWLAVGSGQWAAGEEMAEHRAGRHSGCLFIMGMVGSCF